MRPSPTRPSASSGCDAVQRRPQRRSRAGRARRRRPVRAARAVLIARILIWNLYDSKTTLEELRARLPELPEGDHWVSNEGQDRLGLIAFGDDLPDLGEVPQLIGVDPVIAEEFDVE
jgi:hypothetical protein